MEGFKSRLLKRLRNPWHPVIGGLALGLVNIFFLWFNKKPWGVSKTFARWGTWIADSLGFGVNSWKYWEMENLNTFFSDPETWTNLGIIVGAFLAATLAKEFKFKKIKSIKQVTVALVGGWMMGYGARVALGCNIGGFMNGLASLSLTGWIFAGGIVFGIYIGTKILLKWLI